MDKTLTPAAAAHDDAPALTLRSAWTLAKGAVNAWIDDYAPSMGAALSYYTVFSMAPFLLIVISVAGLVFGAEAVRGELFSQLNGLMGAQAAQGIQDMLASMSTPEAGVVGTVIGVVVLVIGATTVFGELQDALDRIWRAPVRTGSSGPWNLLRTRLLSFGLILGVAFLLMVSLVVGAGVAAFGRWWGSYFIGWEVLVQVINFVVGFAITTCGFALIYKFMPRVVVEWRDVWVGAIVTSMLFSLGRFLIGLYIGKSGVASGFGAAGSIAIVFVWVYYSAQIFLLGAEFTWVYARTFGSQRHLQSPGAAAPDEANAHARATVERDTSELEETVRTATAVPAPSAATDTPGSTEPDARPTRGLAGALASVAIGLTLSWGVRRWLRRTVTTRLRRAA
ncbi:MAG: YihY/virulence factor BrkB family protein [Pseudomonadota bacterium]